MINKKNKFYPPVVLLVIISAFASVIWVGYSVYQAFNKRVDPVVSQEILKPITPSLDLDQFTNIKNSIILNNDEINDTLVETPYEPLEKPNLNSPSPEPSPTGEPIEEVITNE